MSIKISSKSARAQLELNPVKLIFLLVLASIFLQIIYHSKLKISSIMKDLKGAKGEDWQSASGLESGEKFHDLRLAEVGGGFFGLVGFAEAGKKKKKEKSEVVVISVNNPGGGHKSGGMYPIFIPSCGGGSSHGGYGRKRR